MRLELFGTMHFVTYLTAVGVSLLNHYSIFVSHYRGHTSVMNAV